jgi:hypothetical protein
MGYLRQETPRIARLTAWRKGSSRSRSAPHCPSVSGSSPFAGAGSIGTVASANRNVTSFAGMSNTISTCRDVAFSGIVTASTEARKAPVVLQQSRVSGTSSSFWISFFPSKNVKVTCGTMS